MKKDKTSLKAYFRRGQAHMSLNNYEKAKSDFLKAKELSPQEDKRYLSFFSLIFYSKYSFSSIEANLKKIAVWEKQQETKTAQMYKNMFS